MAQRNRNEMMKLLKRVEKQGFEVARTGSGHWKVKSPEGRGSTVLAFSPGSRGLQQTLKQLRAIGFEP